MKEYLNEVIHIIQETINNYEILYEVQKNIVSNVKSMKYMFSAKEGKIFNYKISSLKSLPDISKWNTSNVIDMSEMFSYCIALENMPDISKWNFSNCTDLSNMLRNCKSLKNIPDISKWDISKVRNMSCIFRGCESLKSLPDISKWNTSNV